MVTPKAVLYVTKVVHNIHITSFRYWHITLRHQSIKILVCLSIMTLHLDTQNQAEEWIVLLVFI